MTRKPSPKTLALADQVLAALREGPLTTDEIAEKIGSWPRAQFDGSAQSWALSGFEVYPILARLAKRGIVDRLAQAPGDRRVVWRRLVPVVGVQELGPQ